MGAPGLTIEKLRQPSPAQPMSFKKIWPMGWVGLGFAQPIRSPGFYQRPMRYFFKENVLTALADIMFTHSFSGNRIFFQEKIFRKQNHITLERFWRMSSRKKLIAYSESAWSITPVAVENSRGYLCSQAKFFFPKFNAILTRQNEKKLFFALDSNQCRVLHAV